MSDEFQLSVFYFTGKTQLLQVANKSDRAENDKIVSRLNKSSEEIAKQIESEIQRFLPPFVNVQVGVQFSSGSILMTGTVALFTWVGTTIFKAGKDELEKQLGDAIKAVIQRVISRFLPSESTAPVNISITTQNTGKEIGAPASTSPQPASENNPRLTIILIISIVTLLIQLFLLFDRYFTIVLKP